MVNNFKKKLVFTNQFHKIENYLFSLKVNTVCESAKCPNRFECYARQKMTFMIMGNICTRNCKFCNVGNINKNPEILSFQIFKNELERIKEVIRELNLKYVIITSVTRDDLEDGGASYFSKITKEIKNSFPFIKLEILVPDFKKKIGNIDKILNSGADVIAHNIETIERLYQELRNKSDFNFSLSLLRYVKEKNPEIITKSGFMVGLGENDSEVYTLLKILRLNYVDAVVIGQYFQPSVFNIKVERYVTDMTFKKYENWAKELGFKFVLSSRFARSSSLEIK